MVPINKVFFIAVQSLFTIYISGDINYGLLSLLILFIFSFTEPRKKVLVSGCFDLLHSGHIKFFKEASKLGDLYVRVGSDKNIEMLKKHKTTFNENERLYMVRSIKYVYDAQLSSGSGDIDFEPDLDIIKPDIFYVNDDGDREAKRVVVAKRKYIKYYVDKRIPETNLRVLSSTGLKKQIKQNENEEKKESTPTIKYHYFNGRGYSEPSRVLLSVLGLRFDQHFLKQPDELDSLRSNGSLLYNQLPLIEFNDKKLTQQGAMIRYIATMYNYYGSNQDEKYMIDVVYEGTRDAREPLTNYYKIQDTKKIKFHYKRYFGAWDKLLSQNKKSIYFTTKISFADVCVYEVIDYVQEIFGKSVCEQWLKSYKNLETLTNKISTMGRLHQYRKERKPQPYKQYLKDVRFVFDNAKIDNIFN